MSPPWVVFDNADTHDGDCRKGAEPDIAGLGVQYYPSSLHLAINVATGGNIICSSELYEHHRLHPRNDPRPSIRCKRTVHLQSPTQIHPRKVFGYGMEERLRLAAVFGSSHYRLRRPAAYHRICCALEWVDKSPWTPDAWYHSRGMRPFCSSQLTAPERAGGAKQFWSPRRTFRPNLIRLRLVIILTSGRLDNTAQIFPQVQADRQNPARPCHHLRPLPACFDDRCFGYASYSHPRASGKEARAKSAAARVCGPYVLHHARFLDSTSVHFVQA